LKGGDEDEEMDFDRGSNCCGYTGLSPSDEEYSPSDYKVKKNLLFIFY